MSSRGNHNHLSAMFLLLLLFLFFLSFSVYLSFYFFFFFSSRRRHTRCLSDWSSDVCSSDLRPGGPSENRRRLAKRERAQRRRRNQHHPARTQLRLAHRQLRTHVPGAVARSEERRVGKECRARESPED